MEQLIYIDSVKYSETIAQLLNVNINSVRSKKLLALPKETYVGVLKDIIKDLESENSQTEIMFNLSELFSAVVLSVVSEKELNGGVVI